jgi:hypothetical protein
VSKPSASRKFMPAGWVAVIAIVAAVGIVGSANLRTHRGSAPGKQVAAAPVLSAERSNRVRASLGTLPLAFEANQGQTDPQVKYMARGSGYTVFLTANDTVFALNSSSMAGTRPVGKQRLLRDKTASKAATKDRTAAIHMRLVGGNAQPQIAVGSQLPGRSNYFIGNDPSHWHAGVPRYSRVSYRDVYPGVNMAFHGEQRQLEFDFIVAPGATPAPIRFGVSGTNRIVTDDSGNLILASSAGDVLLHKPIAYQEKDGARQPVDARFAMQANNQVGFELGNYDRGRELVIDPSVSYSTYLGGTAEDDGNAIAVDASGNAYVTGQTKSTNFPTANALHGSTAGGFDVFVTELSADGSTLIYSTYIGGSSDDSGNAIAVDGSGNAFVAGGTNSSNFPTQSPFQGTFGGVADAFALKLNSTGSALTYSTFIGGTGNDVATGLALDSTGNAYIVGSTTSTDFPTQSPIQSGLLGSSNGFVTKLNASGGALDYSTYLGGSNADFAVAVAVDASNNAYVTGGTNSPDFPTKAGFQGSCGTDGTCNGALYDAFVTVINASGSGYVYSTFLGGESNDTGLGVAVDSAGDAYVTGFTSSAAAFPLMSAVQGTFGGGTLDAFVTELNPAGTALVYSTYLGGSGDDTAVAIVLDTNKNAYLTGQTGSSNFPVASPTQSAKKGQNDAFVSEISAGGSTLVFSTYLGGSLNENTSAANGGGAIGAIAVDSTGASIYVTGNTISTDFPTQSPKQAANGGGTDAFVTKYTQTSSGASFTVANGALSVTSGSPGVSATATITVGSTNGFSSAVTLACSVAPVVTKGPTCGVSPSPVTPPANSTVTSTLTVNTTTASALLEHPSERRSSRMLYAILLPVFGITLLGTGLGSAGSRRRKLLGFLMLGMVLAGLLLMPACGGGSSSGGGGTTGTPPGAYTITVTGNGGGATVTGSPALTLTVN